MPRYLYCVMLGAFILVAGPVSGQIVNDARRVARMPWDDKKVTAEVVKICSIPRIYFAVSREYDGFARLRESPSVTSEQHKCAVHVVENRNIPIRK